jgi:phosphoglycolate phosphatase
MSRAVAILFDIDGTLITSGGAGAASWRRAFDDLYGIPADIGEFTDAGMTDPDVGRLTFAAVIGHEPSPAELGKVMTRRLHFLHETVDESTGYRVLPGVEELLPRLVDAGYLLGLTTGNVEAGAHIKLHRARLNRFFAFGGYGSDSTDRAELTKRALERGELVFGASLDRSRCFAVGDTPHDIDAAHGAGIAGVGVASGHFAVEQLRDAGADAVLASLADRFPTEAPVRAGGGG